MPRPRSRPRARLSALRAANPSQSASASALFEQVGEIAAVIGVAVGRSCTASPRAGCGCAGAARCGRSPSRAAARVDQPLHVVIGLGPPGAAIGADRRRVGEHAFGRHFDQRRPVDAERVALTALRVDGPGRAVGGAEIAVPGQPHRQEIAVAVERQLGSHLMVAAVAVRDEAAGALVGPFDRAAEFARRVQDAVIFRHRSPASCRTSRRPGRSAPAPCRARRRAPRRCSCGTRTPPGSRHGASSAAARGRIRAIAERGSIALTTMRLLRSWSRVTCAASAKAAATLSLSP